MPSLEAPERKKAVSVSPEAGAQPSVAETKAAPEAHEAHELAPE